VDYRISFKENNSNNWIEVAKGVTNKFYTVFNLSNGVYYNFKVEARNVYGYS
jgi:hypothetical protein